MRKTKRYVSKHTRKMNKPHWWTGIVNGFVAFCRRPWGKYTISAFATLAAEALGCEPARIAKGRSFAQGEGAIIIVAAGDAKIDNPKYKA